MVTEPVTALPFSSFWEGAKARPLSRRPPSPDRAGATAPRFVFSTDGAVDRFGADRRRRLRRRAGSRPSILAAFLQGDRLCHRGCRARWRSNSSSMTFGEK